MQKWISTLFLGVALLSNTAVNAAWDCWNCQSNVRFDIGYRHDDYEWKLRIPNLTELHSNDDDLIRSNFNNVHVLQVGIHADGTFCSCITARGDAHLGWILDGDHIEKFRFVQDSYYRIDRAYVGEIKNVLDGRNTVDISIALGYPIRCWNSCWTMTPVVGYSYKSQYALVDRNRRADFIDTGESEASTVAEATSKGVAHAPVLYLDNCHDDKWINKWFGPFIGLDTMYDSCNCFRLYGQFEFHFARFKGKRQVGHGSMNMVDGAQPQYEIFDIDFIRNFSVTSRKNTHGYLFRVGAEHDLSTCFYVGLEALFQKFTASKKLDYCEFFEDTCDKFRFNSKLHSWGVKLTFGGRY